MCIRDSYFTQEQLGGPISYRARRLEIAGGQFDIALWSGQDCLKEYALHILKIESLYRLFFENAVSKALVNIAPALPELAILGKVTSGPPRNVGPKMPYDVIVVDAYASGHFMALLNAPSGLGKVVRFGPMGEQVHSIDALLKDRQICHFYVVALPEELPVVEGIELAQNIEKAVGHRPELLLNRQMSFSSELSSEISKKPIGAMGDFAAYLLEVQERQASLLMRLQKTGYHTSVLPWVLSADAEFVVKTLSERLQ